MERESKYDRLASGFAERAYADPERYNLRKVSRAVEIGRPRLGAGDSVLELGCGDGITSFLFANAYGIAVTGVDASAEMVKAAERRCATCDPRPVFLQGDVNDLGSLSLAGRKFKAATLFRASPYVIRWSRFVSEVHALADKLVMDVDPRRDDLAAILRACREGGYRRVRKLPFFTPMTRVLPSWGQWGLATAERVPVVRGLILRFKFVVTVVAESPS